MESKGNTGDKLTGQAGYGGPSGLGKRNGKKFYSGANRREVWKEKRNKKRQRVEKERDR